jgi:hypothetical protein
MPLDIFQLLQYELLRVAREVPFSSQVEMQNIQVQGRVFRPEIEIQAFWMFTNEELVLVVALLVLLEGEAF